MQCRTRFNNEETLGAWWARETQLTCVGFGGICPVGAPSTYCVVKVVTMSFSIVTRFTASTISSVPLYLQKKKNMFTNTNLFIQNLCCRTKILITTHVLNKWKFFSFRVSVSIRSCVYACSISFFMKEQDLSEDFLCILFKIKTIFQFSVTNKTALKKNRWMKTVWVCLWGLIDGVITADYIYWFYLYCIPV